MKFIEQIKIAQYKAMIWTGMTQWLRMGSACVWGIVYQLNFTKLMQVDELNIQHGPKKNINHIVICSTFLSSVIEINLAPIK